jgi:P27 family predicted phage terminase small subunit
VRKLRGNPGKRKVVPDKAAPMKGEHPEPKPGEIATLPIPAPPQHLSKLAKDTWRAYAPELVRSGLLRNLDSMSFEQFCETRARWMRAMKFIGKKKNGETYEKDGVIRLRPEAKIASECAKQLRSYAQEFGLTPAARTKVKHVTGDAPTPPSQPELPIKPPDEQRTGDTPAPPAGQPIEQIPDDEFFRGPPN